MELAVSGIEASVAIGTAVECGFAETAADTAESLLAAPFFKTARRRLEADDFPLRPLVVQDVVGAKFAESKESRAGDELPVVARHPGANGQRREVVTRQEALAGEVSVGVEVGFLTIG